MFSARRRNSAGRGIYLSNSTFVLPSHVRCFTEAPNGMCRVAIESSRSLFTLRGRSCPTARSRSASRQAAACVRKVFSNTGANLSEGSGWPSKSSTGSAMNMMYDFPRPSFRLKPFIQKTQLPGGSGSSPPPPPPPPLCSLGSKLFRSNVMPTLPLDQPVLR